MCPLTWWCKMDAADYLLYKQAAEYFNLTTPEKGISILLLLACEAAKAMGLDRDKFLYLAGRSFDTFQKTVRLG